MDKRRVHQWSQIGGPVCDGHVKHWTEIRATVDEILVMLGCQPGSRLISLHIDRDGSRLTITADEPTEAQCPVSESES